MQYNFKRYAIKPLYYSSRKQLPSLLRVLASELSFSEFWDEILDAKNRTVYQIKAIKKLHLIKETQDLKIRKQLQFWKIRQISLQSLRCVFSPKASKFLHQIQLSNSFHLICDPFCHVWHFNSKLRKTESTWLQFSPLTYRSSLLIVQWC